MKATIKVQLPIPELSSKARDAIVVPGLKRNLGSVSKFSDAGYTTVFHPGEEGVTIHAPNTFQIITTTQPILQGCKSEGLWTVTVDNMEQVGFQQKVNNVYNIPSTKESVRYLHAAAGFPVKESWIDAIKAGNYTTWPGLNVMVVNRYFPESDETQKGHMKKQKQNIRSTKVKEISNQEEDDTPTSPKKKEHDVCIQIFNAEETMHTDQTGRFPANSSSGNKYIMVLVEIDGNYIDGEPMKDQTEGSLIKTYLILWARITASKSVRPKTHVLDNEASEAFKNEIKKNCKIQMVPPDNHRRNLAERAIQTFKHHFKSVLAGVDDSFPINCGTNLNLLRQSNVALTISAFAYVNGPFDYNAMPLAPMGCAAQIYESTNRRKTWAENSINGWYLRTSPEHY